MMFAPVVRDVCLVGGGHSHVLLIRKWAMRPLPGVRLTLISSDAQTPYSGMLPGLIAGHYRVDEIHIDLRTLCERSGVRFIEQSMSALDLDQRRVVFPHRPPVTFDLVSLDTGSTPDLSVEGAAEHATPVKPVHDFYAKWQSILGRLNERQDDTVSVGVVGSGAGGFELVMAMHHALPKTSATCWWFIRGERPLKNRSGKASQLALEAAKRAGIQVVTHVDIKRLEQGKLLAQDGREFALDEILWCTSATGPAWAAQSGLAMDLRGFVATNACLQSISHPFVFATGDIGTQQETPSAKAGVFAVRQAPFLFENIRRSLLGEPLKNYKPQTNFLSLMATGGKRAIASRGPFAIEADWVWQWKNHIDRTFMSRFTDLPQSMHDSRLSRLPDALRDSSSQGAVQIDAMRCRGCGAKVGSRVLDRVISQLDIHQQPRVEPLISPAADTAVVNLPANTLVQSVDQINAIVDEPYALGRIAALHALSDVVTVDATPHSAQVLVTLPSASDVILERDLELLMTGLVEALNEEHCSLIGGHTTEGSELSIGVVVNATLNSAAAERQQKQVLKEGDVLILTQALGTGVLFAALMQREGAGRYIQQALRAMQTSNRLAASLLRENGGSDMTDVTGFGLLGHLDRLLMGTGPQWGASIELDKVPLFSGAQALAGQGIRSSLWPANHRLSERVQTSETLDQDVLSLLYDPQTGGGLLCMVSHDCQRSCIAALHAAGYTDAAVIGQVNRSGVLGVH